MKKSYLINKSRNGNVFFFMKFELNNEKNVVHRVYLYIVYTVHVKHQRLFALIVNVNFLLNLKNKNG